MRSRLKTLRPKDHTIGPMAQQSEHGLAQTMAASSRPRMATTRSGIDRLLLTALVVATLIIAAVAFARYYADPDALWRGEGSDRSSYLSQGVNLALALQHFDVGWLLFELKMSMTYYLRPPIHAALLTPVLLLSGYDVRLATLPSLLLWCAAVVLTALIARRMFDDPLLGRISAGVAAVFAIASPTFLLISNDVMLESGGAALTALASLLFMRACKVPARADRWRRLAITMTVLFYFKPNYWGLAGAALIVAYLAQNPGAWLQWTLQQASPSGLRRIALWLLRQPLLLIAFLMIALAAYSTIHEPKPIQLLGLRITYGPSGLAQQAAAVLLVGLGVFAWHHRTQLRIAEWVAARSFLLWHVAPVLASFLVRDRAYFFFWYVGPSDNFGGHFDPIGAAGLYWTALRDGFTVAGWAALLLLALAGVAFVKITKFDPILRTPFVVLLVCLAAVLLHPNHQGRFLASFIFALWVCAGAGAAALLEPWLARKRRTVAAVGAIAVTMLALASAVPTLRPAAARFAIQTPGPSELELARIYTPYLASADRLGVPYSPIFSQWIMLWAAPIQCRCRVLIEAPNYNEKDFARAAFEDRTVKWVASASANPLVAIATTDGPVQAEWIKDVVARSGRFQLVDERSGWAGSASVMVWRRIEPR